MFYDILRRTLEYLGFEVTQVMNITDVGHLTLTDLQKEAMKDRDIEITDTDDGLDRMEKAAKREGVSVWDVAQKYIDATFGKNYTKVKQYELDGDFGKMNFEKAEFIPRATEMIDEQIELIKRLEAKGYTYKTKQAVYFDISKFPKYEELVGQSFDEMRKGERADVSDKDRKHPADFRLWQLDQPEHEMQWDSPWGKGFPGWHIECSAMSAKLLEIPFDIHTGGEDHIKVHHPSEMAQTESAYDKPMANYWLHNAFLTVEGKRIGKSLGNAYLLSDIIKKGFDPLDLRYFFLQAHYRTKQSFSWENFKKARIGLGKIIDKVKEYSKSGKGEILEDYKKKFVESIEDDLNTPKALAVFWDLIHSDEDKGNKLATILDFDKVLGLRLDTIKSVKISEAKKEEIEKLIQEREKARKEKSWDKADEIRERLEREFNVEVEDKDGGTSWRVK